MVNALRTSTWQGDSEPTLYDVIELLMSLDNRMTLGFETVDRRFDTVDQRFNILERNVSNLAVTASQIQDDLQIIVVDAADDSKTIRDHGRRILKLEHAKS